MSSGFTLVAPPPASEGDVTGLAATGADVSGLLAAGILLALGLVIVALTRRKTV